MKKSIKKFVTISAIISTISIVLISKFIYKAAQFSKLTII